LLHAYLHPKNDSQEAVDAVAGKTVRFFINDRFVAEAVSRTAGDEFLSGGNVYYWVPQHSARNLNLGVGTHKLTAEARYGNVLVKGHGEWRVEKAHSEIISPQIMPVKDTYTVGETITMGGILRTGTVYSGSGGSGDGSLQSFYDAIKDVLDTIVGPVDLHVDPFPIPNATVSCRIVKDYAEGVPFISGPLPTKTISTARTNSQGGFECNFTITLDMFDLVSYSAISGTFHTGPDKAVSCDVYRAAGLAVRFEGDQNYWGSGDVYGFSRPGYEKYESRPFFACPAGTSRYSGSSCPSNCLWGCCK